MAKHEKLIKWGKEKLSGISLGFVYYFAIKPIIN